jgi:tetratricopeptide (TPR) repeat protein
MKTDFYSRIYRQFLGINPGDYQKIIQYFEDNEEIIRGLIFDHFKEMIYAYADALFQSGFYKKYILLADEMLPISIEYEIDQRQFNAILFRKAASLYNIGRLKAAEQILEQLLRIDPENKDVSLFLKKCYKLRKRDKYDVYKACSLFLFFISAAIILVEWLWITPFFEMYLEVTQMIRSGIFLIAFGILAGNYILQEINARFYLKSKRKLS